MHFVWHKRNSIGPQPIYIVLTQVANMLRVHVHPPSPQTKINIKVTMNRTRAGAKIVFNIPAKCTTLFLNSPFYKGVQYWSTLTSAVQLAATPPMFKKYVKSLYKTYANLLGN